MYLKYTAFKLQQTTELFSLQTECGYFDLIRNKNTTKDGAFG